MRLQKYLSQNGLASRRKCEELITEGRVFVNGTPVLELGTKIEPNSEVRVDGKLITKKDKFIYIMLNKPVGFVTSTSDEKNRPIVFELISEIQKKLHPVGRLDINTEGLLIFTNDGDTTFKLTHPKSEIPKVYIVEVAGKLTKEALFILKRGIDSPNFKTKMAKIEFLGNSRYGTKFEITIKEGQNRQIRKMFEYVNCTVKTLKRIQIGEIKLGNLPLGKWRRLNLHEINYLQKL